MVLGVAVFGGGGVRDARECTVVVSVLADELVGSVGEIGGDFGICSLS